MKNIPSNLYPKVLELINETYVDKMDSIESAQVNESGIIEAIAIDEGVRYVCRYADGAIEIKALDPGEKPKTGSFASGKPRNCKTGISCGNSCISKGKTCRKKGTSTQAEKAKEITAEVHPKFARAAKDSDTAPKISKLTSVTDINKARRDKATKQKVTNIGKGLLNRGDVVGALNQQIKDADEALAIAKKEKERLEETRKKVAKIGKDAKDKYPKL